MSKKRRPVANLSRRAETPSGSRVFGLTLRRKLRFGAMGLLVAALILGGVEVLLRLLGYGYPTRFFVKLGAGETLTTNRRFTWPFMARNIATQPFPLLLQPKKEPGTMRLFILGESAAQGMPDPAFGFSRILEVMLNQRFPSNRFEVINVAMRGINSHAILPIARECAELEPDLCLVYMGNNEAIGLHSPEPGAIHLPSCRRWLRTTQWLKSTKLAQAMGDLLRLALKESPQRSQDISLFRRSRMLPDAPCRSAIYDNFRANLEEICRVSRAGGAKVVLSTVAVNLKDFPPLGSLHSPKLTPTELSDWETAYQQGTNAEGRGRLAAAITNYLAAERIDSRYAELHFRLARCHLGLGQFLRARESFALARDWDALAFRTDNRLNHVIRQVGEANQDPGLILVDAEKAFYEHADGAEGIPGRRLFYEHVHLTFDGDYLLARTLLPAVAAALKLEPARADSAAAPSSAFPPLPSRQDCAIALGFSPWDELSVNAAMTRMTAKPPYLDQLEHAEWQARAEEHDRQQMQLFQDHEGFKLSLEIHRLATARRPKDWMLRFSFGMLYIDFKDVANALPELTETVKLMPVFLPARMALSRALFDAGKRAEALEQVNEALRIDPYYGPAQDARVQIAAAAHPGAGERFLAPQPAP